MHQLKNIHSIICLFGPTAAGKTKIALELFERLPCSIISVDSGMVYRYMDIGTAKPSREELARAPHRLIDICDPSEAYSVGRFRKDALREIDNIFAENKIPLLVGGTMLYFRALQEGLADLPSANPEIRARLAEEAKILGTQALHSHLAKIDPEAANRIQPNDLQRLQRALEIYELTGKTLSQLQKENKMPPLPFQIINIALAPPTKSLLDERIQARFTVMLKKGFLDEVAWLFERGDLHANLPAIRAVGYRQAWQYLSGKLNYAEMCERILIATRQLAKHQMTWLRSWQNLTWFDCEDKNVLEKIPDYLPM